MKGLATDAQTIDTRVPQGSQAILVDGAGVDLHGDFRRSVASARTNRIQELSNVLPGNQRGGPPAKEHRIGEHVAVPGVEPELEFHLQGFHVDRNQIGNARIGVEVAVRALQPAERDVDVDANGHPRDRAP